MSWWIIWVAFAVVGASSWMLNTQEAPDREAGLFRWACWIGACIVAALMSLLIVVCMVWYFLYVL